MHKNIFLIKNIQNIKAYGKNTELKMEKGKWKIKGKLRFQTL